MPPSSTSPPSLTPLGQTVAVVYSKRMWPSQANLPDAAEVFIEKLAALGATTMSFPVLSLHLTGNALPALLPKQWVAFTSAKAVDAFFTQMPPVLPPLRIAAVGQGTQKALAAYGQPVHCMPSNTISTTVHGAASEGAGSGDALAHALVDAFQSDLSQLPDQPILWPCQTNALPLFPNAMQMLGYEVRPWVCYEARELPECFHGLEALCQKADMISWVCTSPNALQCLYEECQALGQLAWLTQMPMLVMGQTTAKAYRVLFGKEPAFVPDLPDFERMVDALIKANRSG